MAHINLKNELPGIRGLMAFRPETARPLNALAEVLLRDDNNSLTRGERELIGAYVSSLNDCFFCQNVHGALAQYYMQCDTRIVDEINKDVWSTKIKILIIYCGKCSERRQKCYNRTNTEGKRSGCNR